MLIFLLRIEHTRLTFLFQVNCTWGSWEIWGSCSKSCGGGIQIRARKVSFPEKNGGNPCKGISTDQKSCNKRSCPSGKSFHSTNICMFSLMYKLLLSSINFRKSLIT